MHWLFCALILEPCLLPLVRNKQEMLQNWDDWKEEDVEKEKKQKKENLGMYM